MMANNLKDLDLSSPVAAPKRGAFFNLPRELQLHIFSFFTHEELCTTVAPVCQEWWRLSKDPSLWKYLDIFVDSEEKTSNLALLLERSPMLKELKIETLFSLEEFAVTSHACPMLKQLDLTNCCEHVDDRIFAKFVQNCPLIEELILEGCGPPVVLCRPWSMSSIACLTHLKVLNLSQCTLVEDNDIQLILEKCRHLECLELLHIRGITDKSACKIENLKLTLRTLTIDAEMLTDLAFQNIGLCTALQHITIFCGRQLTDQTLFYLKKLTSLNSLQFTALTSLTTVAVNDFFTGPCVHNLVELWIGMSSISDHGMYNVTKHCKLLTMLRLRCCDRITEVGLEHIVNHCHHLVNLHLSGLDNVTGLCLQSIPEKLSFLKLLEVIYCNGISLESVLFELVFRVPKLKVCHDFMTLVQ